MHLCGFSKVFVLVFVKMLYIVHILFFCELQWIAVVR